MLYYSYALWISIKWTQIYRSCYSSIKLILINQVEYLRVELASFLISNLTIKQESNEYYSAMAPIINCKTIISKLKAFALDISLNENPDTTEIIYLLQIFENLLLNSTFLKNYSYVDELNVNLDLRLSLLFKLNAINC